VTLVTFPAPPGQQQWLRRESLADKIGWVDASVEVVRAFECGINFGRKVAPRRQYPLWTEDEWREALQNAVGEPDVAYYADNQIFNHPVIMNSKTGRIFIDLPDGGWHELRRTEPNRKGLTPVALNDGVWAYLAKLAKEELGMDLVKPTISSAAKAGR
jgi:hypothetical protein